MTTSDTTHCKRYGHTAGHCRSRLAAQESRIQQQDARKQQQQHQYQLEVDALTEKEEAEHAELNWQFEAETARIEGDPSSDDTMELLLQELADKESSVTWLRERYAEMRSSVASRHNIPDDTPPVQADSLMDVDAALTPQGIPAGGADVTTSTVEVASPSSPQVPPASEVADPSQPTDHSSTEDTEGEDDHSDDTTPVAEEAPPPAPVPPAQLFKVAHYFDQYIVDEHLYHMQIVAIPPHQLQKPAVEEDVLQWLWLRRHDCSLQWDGGDNLVFRTSYCLDDAVFARPAGPYTWTLRADVAHFSSL